MLDTDEVVLAPRIIVIVERVELLDLGDNRELRFARQCAHTRGYHDPSAPKCFPEPVIEFPDFGAALRHQGCCMFF